MIRSQHASIEFPEFSGARCYMMPFIQGRPESIPSRFEGYRHIVESQFIPGEEGQMGHITIDESYVDEGTSQRGYGAADRSVHTEACKSDALLTWGPSPFTWGSNSGILIEPDLTVLIANSIDDTCVVWDEEVPDTTFDGDLSHLLDKFPRETGRSMKAGEVFEIGIFTPHECVPQKDAGNRQFFRIVGNGVSGRSDGFTDNPLL